MKAGMDPRRSGTKGGGGGGGDGTNVGVNTNLTRFNALDVL